MRHKFQGLFALLLLSLFTNSAYAAQCDVNDDGFIDRGDVRAIAAARGQSATGPDDPRDADGNGTITVGDSRACVLQCSLPRCAPQPEPQDVAVPNLVGQTQAQANAALSGVGLATGTVTSAASDSVPAGSVISQNPTAGTEVAPGTAVALVLSSGPELVGVPNVVGSTESQALAAITGAGLNVAGITAVNSATAPAGNVISQNPAAGSNVAPGSNVDLVVSTGPQAVVVPNLVGNTEVDAGNALTAAGLTLGTTTTASSNTVPAGSVISQDPAAGAQAAPGSAVNLVISDGPEMIAVPDVVGSTEANASSAIVGAGLVVGTVDRENDANVPTGAVISQDPAAASNVALGSAVNLVVSDGPELITVPNVVGLSQDDAELELVEINNLTLGSLTFENSDTVPEDEVISQNPLAGAQLAFGGSVDLVISLGPAVVSVDSVVADADPEFVPINVASTINCEALDSNGIEVPNQSFTISVNPTGNLVGDQFSSSVADEFLVTCALDGSVLSAATEVVVLPDNVAAVHGDLQDEIEDLADLSLSVDVANDEEDVPALQALKSAIQAKVADIDLVELAANMPLRNDADRPTDQQLIDELGDVPNPAVDDPWKQIVLDYRANVVAYRAKLASVTPATVTTADVLELQDLTDALAALGTAVETLEPSHTAVFAMNDEINELYTDLIPNEAIEGGNSTVAIINTVNGIVGLDPQRWQLQHNTPAQLYAGLAPSAMDSAEFFKHSEQAFSFISVLTSQSIANSLRKTQIKAYKKILKSWQRTAKAALDLDPPMGIDPPMLFTVLPTAFPDNTPFQVLLDGNNFVVGNTTVSIDVIVSGSVIGTVTAPVSTSGGSDPFAVADVPALGLSCNIFTACAARVKVITPGGSSNEVAANVF